jgi:hypothetical protein
VNVAGVVAALAVLFTSLAAALVARAGQEILFQSATMGPTTSDVIGNPVLDTQALGVRFELQQPVVAERIGAHLLRHEIPAFGSVPASIVRLTGATDYPDSTNRSTPDFLATAFLTPPRPSNDVTAPIGPLTLEPGWYALLFGDWRNTGSHAVAVRGNPVVGNPTYCSGGFPDPPPFFHDHGPGVSSERYFLLGEVIPEPASSTLLLALLVAAPLVAAPRRGGRPSASAHRSDG